MGVMIRKTNNIPRITKAMEQLGKREIKVGVFGQDKYEYPNDADLVTIAAVHEFGTTIVPKTAKWLTIPLIPAAKGKRASDFGDELFFRKGDVLTKSFALDGHFAFLSRKKGKRGNIENVFLLVKSVKIPERSFLRSGFDANVDKITDKIEKMVNDVVHKGVDPDIFLDAIGTEFAGLIQKHMRGLSEPGNSKITKAVKRSSNPLMDTGRLVGAIRHEID